MQNFILSSLIVSLVLTVVLNILPMLFPKSSAKVERKIHEKISETVARREVDNHSRVRVFFPWKVMLVISVGLTIVVNVISCIAAR